MTQEISLDDSVTFRGRTPDDGYGGELLLTGATSLLGGYLLAELLERGTAVVHVPVQAADFATGYDLIRRRLADCGRWVPGYAERISPVPADLARAWLGMRPASFADLGARLDAIYHCAADDHLVKSYQELAPVNVAGTHELLRLAGYGRGVRFHQLSIITIAPVDATANLCTETWPEDRTDATGYVRSRWAAEHLVAQAARRGLGASVYRTTTLTGDGRYMERDVFVEYIASTVRAGVHPRDRVGQWTPADYAARAIAALAEDAAGVYHIPSCTVPLDWVWQHVSGWDYPLRAGSDSEWRAAIRATGQPLAYLLDGPDQPADPPRPDCSRTLAAIGGILGAPAITPELVGHYLDGMRREGLI